MRYNYDRLPRGEIKVNNFALVCQEDTSLGGGKVRNIRDTLTASMLGYIARLIAISYLISDEITGTSRPHSMVNFALNRPIHT